MLALNAGRPHTARINDTEITVGPRETLLQAALREGLPFPNSCRVGGCGSCKCRLVEGEVDELTESGYLLSADELDRGTILACQSRPRSAVRIEVELAREAVPGEIVEQTRLTHDITALTVQLDAALDYRPGQFARLTLDGLDDVTRSYSFATPPSADGRVQFFVRHVPGGRFSGHVHREDLVGQGLAVEGPDGDFWLREGEAPLILVAGGSGLAPILALLQAAADAGCARPATLLFGARTRRDLYALDAIEAIAERWNASFHFVPVLSEVDDDDEWPGARGLVTAHIGAHLAPRSHAYLCGPPAMVDAAIDVLAERGVDRDDMHFDRFTTRADGPVASGASAIYGQAVEPDAADEREPAGAWHYLKHLLFHAIGLFAAGTLLSGGSWITVGLIGVVAFYVIGDAIGGDDTSTPRFGRPGILTGMLWSALPLIAFIVFCAVWSVADRDIFGFGAWLGGLTGYDLLAAREATTWGHHLSGIVLTGLMVGMIATIPAHELTHRTWDPLSLGIGRWLLAFSFDTVFAIEHVYGHHRYVSTTLDPATAPRGRNVYAHVLISTVRGNISAWHIERERLVKRRRPLLSPGNAVIRGHLMSALLVAVAGLIGGWVGALYFTAIALVGKALLEIVNYMEHYGIVRDPATPVQPRHSWNTNRRVSSWALFNLTRHSHHHAQGEVPYQDLRPYPEAPLMINGYLTTLIITLLPPLWHRLMVPKLREWDRVHATPRERELAAEANAKSGLPGLHGARVEAAVPALP